MKKRRARNIIVARNRHRIANRERYAQQAINEYLASVQRNRIYWEGRVYNQKEKKSLWKKIGEMLGAW